MNMLILSICISKSIQIEASNSKDKILVFFKLRPDVITEDNLHTNILVSSMLDSPINMLYQAVRQVFAPILLKVSKYPKYFNIFNDFFLHVGHILEVYHGFHSF